MKLDRDDVEAVARRVAEILEERGLAAPAGHEMINAEEVARRFGVKAAWVRRNADRLGAIRLGSGARPRLRFDPETVAATLSVRDGGETSRHLGTGSTTGPEPRRRRPARTGRAGQLPPRNLHLSALPERTAPRRANARGPAPGGRS